MPRPDITVPFPKVNPLNVKAVMFAIQQKIRSDPDFVAKLKRDPIGVLQQFGIPRTVAVAIVADDVGIVIRPTEDMRAMTDCCCSACSVSHARFFEEIAVLPAANDLKAWKGLMNKRPSTTIDPNIIDFNR
jgi:hypothetical protein